MRRGMVYYSHSRAKPVHAVRLVPEYAENDRIRTFFDAFITGFERVRKFLSSFGRHRFSLVSIGLLLWYNHLLKMEDKYRPSFSIPHRDYWKHNYVVIRVFL